MVTIGNGHRLASSYFGCIGRGLKVSSDFVSLLFISNFPFNVDIHCIHSVQFWGRGNKAHGAINKFGHILAW